MRVLLAALLLASCAPPQIEEALPRGDRAVTTYGRVFGLEATVHNNREAALNACPEGYVILDESFGRDEDGLYRRWEYGCLAR